LSNEGTGLMSNPNEGRPECGRKSMYAAKKYTSAVRIPVKKNLKDKRSPRWGVGPALLNTVYFDRNGESKSIKARK